MLWQLEHLSQNVHFTKKITLAELVLLTGLKTSSGSAVPHVFHKENGNYESRMLAAPFFVTIMRLELELDLAGKWGKMLY